MSFHRSLHHPSNSHMVGAASHVAFHPGGCRVISRSSLACSTLPSSSRPPAVCRLRLSPLATFSPQPMVGLPRSSHGLGSWPASAYRSVLLLEQADAFPTSRPSTWLPPSFRASRVPPDRCIYSYGLALPPMWTCAMHVYLLIGFHSCLAYACICFA